MLLGTRRCFLTLASGSLVLGGMAAGLPAFARGGDDALPNTFFSPHGRPYRAPTGAPYPVADWFKAADRNGDGKLDRDEFVADAAAFFAFLDVGANGVLGPDDISFYEHRIAPEVLGQRVLVYADGSQRVWPAAPRLWLAQYIPDNGGPDNGPTGPMNGGPMGQDNRDGPDGPGGPGQPGLGGNPHEGEIVPNEALPGPRQGPNIDPTVGVGASPYSLIREPEPVTAADPDYVERGVVRKAQFLAHAHDNFAQLDRAKSGFLTLDSLPRSQVQLLLARG